MDKRFHALMAAIASVRSASSFSLNCARVVIHRVGNVVVGHARYCLGPCEGCAFAMAVVGAARCPAASRSAAPHRKTNSM